MLQKRRVFKIISRLIHANEYRCEVYRRCYNKANATDLKIAFNKYYSSAITNVGTLSAEADKLGFQFPEAETAVDSILNVLLDLYAAVSGNGRDDLLNACRHAEGKALACYREAKKAKELSSAPLSETLSIQMEGVMEAIAELKRLKTEFHSKENAVSH